MKHAYTDIRFQVNAHVDTVESNSKEFTEYVDTDLSKAFVNARIISDLKHLLAEAIYDLPAAKQRRFLGFLENPNANVS